ncbi:MAG: DUF1861 family protein, partial [Actinomycetes bacterium]
MSVCAADLLLAYRASGTRPLTTSKLTLTGIDGFDGYNITHPFDDGGRVVLGVRVELRHDERSTVRFFDRTQADVWASSSRRTFDLQDPFVSVVAGDLIFGGVQIEPNPDAGSDGEKWRYRTILYRGATVDEVTAFVVGPWGMKDVRLVELPDARVGVFTRPQGGSAGRGQI